MALKPDRNITNGTDISFFINHVVERGGIVTFDPDNSGSGAAMDQSTARVVGTGDAPSGTIPAGLLLNDVVNLDLTRQHINWHKDEVQKGGKATVLRHGTVVTNVVAANEEPNAGSGAFYTQETFGDTTSQWVLSTINPTDLESEMKENRYLVGTFLTKKDEDGYVKVAINVR